MNKKNFIFFDIFKFVFAIFVIGIHTSILQGNTSTLEWYVLHGLFRLAVPSFFVISGFFFGKKIYNKSKDERRMITNQYIKRLLYPFIFWLLLNLPFKFYEYYQASSIFGSVIRLIRDLLFYPWGAMWYVSSLIVAVLLINFALEKIEIKKIVAIGGVLYMFALLCNNYFFVIENTFIGKIIRYYMKIFVSARNGIFVGLLFVSLGIWIYKMFIDEKINYRKCFMAMIISYLLLIGEIFLIKGKSFLDDGALYISLMIFIPFFIAYFTKYQLSINTTVFRKISSGIYFMHRFIIASFEAVFSLLVINYSLMFEFIFVSIVSVALVTIFHFINNEKINKLMF